MLTLLFSLRDCFHARAVLQAEILALRHQLLVLQRSSRGPKLRLRFADRILWVWLSRLRNDWRSALLLVKPTTVIAWHRKGFLLLGMVEDLRWERRAETTSRTRPVPVRPAQDQNCGSEESRDSLAYPPSTIYGRLEACSRGRFRRYTEGSPGGRDSQPLIAG
jgi:hypothetical protein